MFQNFIKVNINITKLLKLVKMFFIDLSNINAIKSEENTDLTLSQDSFSNISHNLSNSSQIHVSLSNQPPQQLQQQQHQHHQQQPQQQQQQTPPHLTPDNIQPLPSNIINRHTNNIEVYIFFKKKVINKIEE